MGRPFHEAATGFVWSMWGEIGVPSVERRTVDVAIDLEALIRLTDVVGAGDPRLRSHVAVWADTFPELVSRARLKRLGGEVPGVVQSTPRGSISGGASLDVARASAVQLRLRSAIGVSARAEIVRQFVIDSAGTRHSASELAQLAGYTKRNVEKALVSLERGRWVTRVRGGASLRWVLTDHTALASLFSPLPTSNISFLALARIVEGLVELDNVATASRRVRSAAARQSLFEMQATADWGNIGLPVLSSTDGAWDVVLAWSVGLPSTAR